MKNKRIAAEILMILCYIFDLYHLYMLCQYGGAKRHLLWMFLGLLIFSAALIYRQISNTQKIKSKTAFLVQLLAVVMSTILFGSGIVYSAIPYNGKLAWKIDDLIHERKVVLKHDNIYATGLQGILDDLDNSLNLPDTLYIAEQFTIDFKADGHITAIEGFLYGKNEQDETKTYLISYQSASDKKITVTMDGYANAGYDTDALLSPMEDLMSQSDWQEQVANWSKNYGTQTYELLYLGSRSFETKDGLIAVSGDANEIRKLDQGGSVKGYELSLHMPDLDTITPIRYMADPVYTSWEQEKQAQDDSSEDSSPVIGESFTDENGSIYFYLSDTTGWRFKVIDAAAGSRFYGLQQTTDGGENWEMINEDPFVGMIGVAEGLVFFDENNGIIGLTCAGQDWSYLYRTADGGKTFTQIAFPGAGVDEYYYDMPRQDKDQLVVLARPEAGAASGVKFVSKDGGMTWENVGDF